jgi:NAD(P) transhydrogenase subunit beta
MAAGKLQGFFRGAVTYRGQTAPISALLTVVLGNLIYLIFVPSNGAIFPHGGSLAVRFLLIIPIGAADMPVVISLLNSYAGLADAAMGFVLMNKIQIITGSLDGTSGFLLSLLMCRAMNRSAWNVLFGAFGKIEQAPSGPTAGAERPVLRIMPDEVPALLDSCRSVIIVQATA